MTAAVILWGMLSLSPGLLSAAQKKETLPPLFHEPVETFTHGEKIPFSVLIDGEAEQVRLFYRHPGIEEFQVRTMAATTGAGFVHHLDTADLAGLTLEYYIEALIAGEKFLLPVDAPESCFRAEGESPEDFPGIPEDLPDPQSRKTKIQWPLNVTGSMDYPVWEDGPVADSVLQSAGNIALDLRLGRDPDGYIISANTSYANQPLPGENPFNLSNMLISLAAKHHSLKAGDLFIQETEFTAAGLGRRGVSYGFDSRKITFGFFNVQSQQVRGFDGFGIPKAGVGLIGGSLGFRLWQDRLSIKAVFIDGKDDPRLGVNVGASYFNATARKGRVFSLSPEARFLKNKVALGGEFAVAEFDGDLSDEEPAHTDQAWRIAGDMNFGKVQVRSAVRRIGKEFQPIGQQYFTKDRLGHDTTLSAAIGRLNFFGSFSGARDNIENNPAADTTENQSGNLNINWAPFRWLSMTLGYQMNSQDTRRDDGIVLFQQDSRMNAFSGGLNLTLGSFMVLTFQASETEQSSRNNPSAAVTSQALNLGGMFRGGQVLTLNPTLSYTRSRSPFTGNDMRMLGSFILMDVQIVRNVLSTALSGSYSHMDTGGFGASENLAVSGFLNLHLAKLIRIGDLVLSGRGTFGRMGMGDFSQTTKSAALKCDFSF